VKPAVSGRSLWILDPWKDLALFVLSPLWIIPFLWVTKAHFDLNGFGAVFLAVGGVGHHLPGFIRAYTDPVMFRRFRMRFILAPVFFLAVCATFAALHLQSLTLVLTLWGIWHGAMQVNGFLRIYDAKAGSFASSTSWLDWAMCIAWFGGGLLYSARLIVVLSYYFRAGGPVVPPTGFLVFRQAWVVVIAAVTAAFLVNAWKEARAGRAPNPVKLLMMVSSFGVWWFAMVHVNSLLLAVLIFEIVHDVQYNTLVWVYNERRVSQRMTASWAEKYLFQPGVLKLLLYAGLVLAYGSIGVALDYVEIQVPSILQIEATTVRFWTSLFIVTTFLHFYFDGFIWQVRENNFQRGLRIGNGGTAGGSEQPRVNFMDSLHSGWKWAFFVIPVAALGYFEHQGARLRPVDQARNVAQLIPERWQADAVAAFEEESNGDESAAIEHLERSIDLNPEFSKGEAMLGDIFSRHGNVERATRYYLEAVSAYPKNYAAQDRLAVILLNERRYAEAIPHLEIAVEDPRAGASVDYMLGAALVEEKRPLEGIPYLQRAVQLDPTEKEAYTVLGVALQTEGEIKEAAAYYRQALKIDPTYAPAREDLAQVEHLITSGQGQ
jgi:Tfp pilus assembly protein PilF